MGRKRWRRGSLGLLLLFIFHQTALADVGCLFSKNVCDTRTEICYNDRAFGRCIPLYANLEDEDLYQYNFNGEELELLKLELERLEIDGYKWTHPYTQCIMQISLYNLRHGENYDLRLCQHFKQHDRFGPKSKFDDVTRVPTIAIVKFLPNHGDTETEFANELYYPPRIVDQSRRKLFEDDFLGSSTPYEDLGKAQGQPYRPGYSVYNEYSGRQGNEDYENFENLENFERTQPYGDLDENRLYRARRQPYNLLDYADDAYESVRNRLEDEQLSKILLEAQNAEEKELEFLVKDKLDYPMERQGDEKAYERTFSRKYKHQRKFSHKKDQDEMKDADEFLVGSKRNSNLARNLDYDDNDDNDDNESNYDDNSDNEPKGDRMYTEGGLVQPIGERSTVGNTYDALLDDEDLDDLLWRREMAGFKRRERLDVKKPGPPFSTNNYAFKSQASAETGNDLGRIEENDTILEPLVKKELAGKGHPDEQKIYKNVDLDHVYIEFQQPFHTWSQGEHVVKEVSKLLGLKQGTLRDIRVGRAEVTFKVTPNSKNINAIDVAKSINDIRGNLRDTLGVEVIRAGIGDKAKLPATLEVTIDSEMSSSLFGAVVAAGVAAAGAAAAVTLIIARRHAKSRAKLAGLATPDPEASKDYQDLCRARMQAKQPTDKPESPRITNLTKENESNSLPSNRSSTSSWTEEPSLMNMDISTGQMVLSYMEDHLKNKDRLDQEWAALCAYEADPCSTEIAESKENAKLNRPGAALPYDHSRVVLNELANANNSDYVNASTITDHDPRNPAYIATQGPLPQTTADFWQMVWEQGSVVIVTLTRLTEEGVAMCHRYWPQEDSELYHIYEVHLVSEHIWRDDYLVRSFYLKNLRTGETRTVTQFHFLSWPENGVPQSTKALLEFRRKVNKSYRGRSCPIIVHCSDGAGRTGTYCLIDMVLNRMMKGAKEIDIAATLEHIRDQRHDMVATKQQFEFVLMAVAEEVHAVLKALLVPATEKSPAQNP